MKRKIISIIVIALVIMSFSTFMTYASDKKDLGNNLPEKHAVITEIPSVIHLEAEKLGVNIEGMDITEAELAVKDAITAYNSQNPVDENAHMVYFYETAKKLNVNIEGLTDDEIMYAVKNAEVELSKNQPAMDTKEYERLVAEKMAMVEANK